MMVVGCVVVLRELQSIDRAVCLCLLLVLYLEGFEVAVVGGTALKPDLPVVIHHSWNRLLRWLYLESLKFVLVTRHASEWHSIFVLWMLVPLQLRHGKRMMRGFIH